MKRTSSAGRKARGPSQRQLRAGELIRHTLVDILTREDLRDPLLVNTSITISEVRTTPDLKQADVYCMPLGGKQAGLDEKAIISALNTVAPYLRSLLAKQIDMKYTPQLNFRKDESFDEASRIEALLARPDVARDLEEE